MSRPLLLLDVDGVICPFGMESEELPGYEAYEGLLPNEQFSPVILDRLRSLMKGYRFVWATAWAEQANDVLAPIIGFPPLPLVDFTKASLAAGESYKLGPIKEYVGDQPMVWIDDMIYDDAFEWAAMRKEPTLLLRTESHVGLIDEHFDALDAFLASTATPGA